MLGSRPCVGTHTLTTGTVVLRCLGEADVVTPATVEGGDPPDEPDATVATFADQTIDVVGDLYTRVELEPGAYWVLTNSVVGETTVVTCDGGEIGEVVPAP